MGTTLLVNYKFKDEAQTGKDCSGNNFHAVAAGVTPPRAEMIGGRSAATFAGGANGTSYFEVPKEVFEGISDANGISIVTWVKVEKNGSIWQRIADFGKGETGPYLFLTRNLRGVCFAGEDLAADPFFVLPHQEWVHVAMTISGTEGGTKSAAGPVIYINGEVAADGRISQTTSGLYGKLRGWFSNFAEKDTFVHNYIGRSQFAADEDFCGSLSDFRIYQGALEEKDIVALMCESYSEQELVELAARKYLKAPEKLAVRDYRLPSEFLQGKVQVQWTSSRPELVSETGKRGKIERVEQLVLTAALSCGAAKTEKSFTVTALPDETVPYTIRVHAKEETMPVSETLWGLFYEDINNAADGGIYAEQIQNRSFENFQFAVYDARSQAEGRSSGRIRKPLEYWFGDLAKCEPHFKGGLNEQFGLSDEDANNCYLTVQDGAVISNRGFCDTNHRHSIVAKKGDWFDFSIWARTPEEGSIEVWLRAEDGSQVSEAVTVPIHATKEFIKYGLNKSVRLKAKKTAHSELVLCFHGTMDIDFVSLMPEQVWGASEEPGAPTAHLNYKGNSNYRLRKDMVEALKELHPSFLRFPGGCISEGSYIWENVYDWKDSVGAAETRKENYNVWGYVMTMGLGYMEYFQLAEDLGATPLPVMACGVLCQARSDYANPAGGALEEKYIKNFTDLIDFAISTDFAGNEWAALRKEMGHEAPFDLHYLGVGNENWGEEFMASFERYYDAITAYLNRHYPGYPMTIISTVGAQADDDAYRLGWKFLAGRHEGTSGNTSVVQFTDGQKSWDETVTWYEKRAHYMDTIADEHYYRPNEYLLQNADRYEFYERAYTEDGRIDETRSSKVFVGEYASSDKNTLAGAVAEAAVMTGFENNTDVVRLAATAPLFNKVLTDSQYRWTPDCIWFDGEKVWHTPTYYVQQMFAANLGKKVVATEFETYEDGKHVIRRPHGGISVTSANSSILVKEVVVVGEDNTILLKEDLTNGFFADWRWIKDGALLEEGEACPFEMTKDGLLLPEAAEGENGMFLLEKDWSRYTLTVKVVKCAGTDGFLVGAGFTDATAEQKNGLQYVIGQNGATTGIRVFKNGVEGYTLGDFSSSICAGNLRSARYEEVREGVTYTITFDYRKSKEKEFSCFYTDGEFESEKICHRLLPYCREVFHSATKDEEKLYVKLVNADETEKKAAVWICDEKVCENATLLLLAGEEGMAHVPDINTKEEEPVKPRESKVMMKGGKAELVLPAQSVAVLTCIREK